MSLTGNMLAVGTIGAWILILVSYASYRWKRPGTPSRASRSIIVRDGELISEAAMRIERLTEDEVLAEAREQGIDDLAERAAWRILEADGKFTFIKDEASEGSDDEETPGSPRSRSASAGGVSG